MASALYDTYKEDLLTKDQPDVAVDPIEVAAVDLTVDYTFSAAHDFKNDVTSYTGSTDQVLGTITTTNGVFDAADSTYTALAQSASKTVGALVVFHNTAGAASTDPLIAYLDGWTAVVPNGGDIDVAWNASGIFSF